MAATTGAEPGGTATLDRGVGYAGKGGRESILDGRAGYVTGSNIRHYNRVDILSASDGGRLSIGQCHLQVCFENDGVGISGDVVCRVWIADSGRSSYLRRVRQRASRSRAEFTARFVDDFARGRHRDNIINVATSTGRKAGRATSLGGRKCQASQRCWEAVRY